MLHFFVSQHNAIFENVVVILVIISSTLQFNIDIVI